MNATDHVAAHPESLIAPIAFAEAWHSDAALQTLNAWLDDRTPQERVAWALAHAPSRAVMSSSFGAQSAAALHLVTRVTPKLPVLLVDTGYLFPETYRFADSLQARLQLNLQIVQPEESAAHFEARHGALWEKGVEGIERYNEMRKVRPMQDALHRLGTGLWIAGLRRSQSESRAQRKVLERHGTRWKLHPLVNWTDRDVGRYLSEHALPYHPLWEQGYVSIGDVHTTRPLSAEVSAQETRFFGLKRECGLHEAV